MRGHALPAIAEGRVPVIKRQVIPTSESLAQSASMLTTSLLFVVPMACHAMMLTEVLMNRTEPSMKSTFCPPGWFEVALTSVIVPRPSSRWSE